MIIKERLRNGMLFVQKYWVSEEKWPYLNEYSLDKSQRYENYKASNKMNTNTNQTLCV